MNSPIRFYPLFPFYWHPFWLEYIGTSSYFFVYRHFRLQKSIDYLAGCQFILFFLHSISVPLAFCRRYQFFSLWDHRSSKLEYGGCDYRKWLLVWTNRDRPLRHRSTSNSYRHEMGMKKNPWVMVCRQSRAKSTTTSRLDQVLPWCQD